MKRIFLALITVFSLSSFADSSIYIDVGQAQVKKSLLALTPFLYFGTQSSNHVHISKGQTLYQVIHNDLSVSNFFTFIKPEAYLEDPSKESLEPAPGDPKGFHFKNWQTIGTEFLVRGGYNIIGKQISLKIFVYHVPDAKVVLAKTYQSDLNDVRRLGHTFSNDLVKALTGKKGMFLTRMVASCQKPGSIHKEIYVMDWDAANQKRVSFHKSIAISPAWSHDGDRIAYTAYAYHTKAKVENADLFIYSLKNHKRWLVSYRKGINSGANWFPGDQFLLLTLTIKGSADIYKMSADGNTLLGLTHGPNRAMNVEPAVSPDGKKIAFSSDRSGRPMIYVMNIDGTHIKRLTFAGHYNSSPAWSPDGKVLAFAGYDKNHFDIFTINTDGTGLKRLTDAKKINGKPSNNESPTWSPDGRLIAFYSDRTTNKQIYVVSPDGTNERRITHDNYNWERPKWSPFLN